MKNCNGECTRKSVLITPGKSLGITDFSGNPKKDIVIDECISGVIKHLWGNGHATLNCCCGHNQRKPSIIIPDGAPKEQADEIRACIAEVDDRDFKLLSWNLIEI